MEREPLQKMCAGNYFSPGSCTVSCEGFQPQIVEPSALRTLCIGHSGIRKMDNSNLKRGWRTQTHIRQDQVDDFLVVIPLQEPAQVLQSGRKVVIAPGNITLLSTARPFEALSSAQGYSEISVWIPGAVLRSRVPYIDECCALTIDGKRGVGRILHTLIDTMLEEVANDSGLSLNSQESLLVTAVESVLTGTSYLAELGQTKSNKMAGEQLFAQAINFIESHLSEPGLGPRKVAQACRISVNHLHTVFAKNGQESVMHCIRRLRVAQVRKALSHVALTHRTITELAFEWGFNSYAAFNRAYHEQLGCAPSMDRDLIRR